MSKIFPFIDTPLGGECEKAEPQSDDMVDDEVVVSDTCAGVDSKFIQIRELLSMLRRNLCQDMLVIKKRYPHNPLLTSEIFNSTEFEEFVKEVEKDGDYDRLMRESCSILKMMKLRVIQTTFGRR